MRFDTVYIKGQIKAYQMTIANFQTEMNNGNNSQLKAYVTENMPHVQMHLDSENAIYIV